MEETKKNEHSENAEQKGIDLQHIVEKLWKQKMLYAKVLPVVFVVSCLYIICIPRTYSSDIKLAPEMDNSMGGGTLGDIASSLGFNLSDMQTSDAITPLLYPDLMDDNKFVSDILDFQVGSLDGTIKCSYGDYLKEHQKKPWWGDVIDWVKSFLPKGEEEDPIKASGLEKSPYLLTMDEDQLLEAVRGNITLRVDKKTGIITIATKAQDALICKTLADSMCAHLQSFITDYRTKKARIDSDHYRQLMEESKANYEKARQLYGSYADANTDIVLESYRAKRNDLENDMQLKYNSYTTMTAQYQAAQAKVQERTPAFTMIKGATVPIKPTGPKRMFFVAGMLVFATLLTSLYIYIKK
jgi:hypothetical protein